VVAQLALAMLVFERTHSALGSSLTFALGFLPQLVGGTLLSSVADRFPVRRTLICCDLASAAVVALMAVPGLPVPLLLALLLPLGAIAPVFQGARAASLPEVLGGEAFALGRSLLRMVAQTSQVWGFAFGGLLLAALSPRPLLLVDAASFLASAVLLRLGTRERPPRAVPPTDLSTAALSANPAATASAGASAGTAPGVSASGALAASAGVARRSVARDSLDGVRLALGSARLRPLLLLYWLPPAFTVPRRPWPRPMSPSSAGAHRPSACCWPPRRRARWPAW
jgi:hypothetical protein